MTATKKKAPPMPAEVAGTALPVLLDANPLGDPDGARRSVTAYTRALTERMHLAVAQLRHERAERLGDLPLGRTDVAPLVRQVAAFADVMKYAAAQFAAIAKDANEIVGDEAKATGEDRIVVGDGLGREVVVKTSAPRTRVCDWPSLLDALAGIRAVEHRAQVAASMDGEPPEREVVIGAVMEAEYERGYRQAQEDIASVSTAAIEKSVSTTKVDGLSRALQAHGQDDLAGLLDRTMWWESGEARTMVTVEDPKARRRG